MIEKIPGRPQINKLRVIHLLEADLNLALGIIWSRRLMKQGEKLGPLETNGSRNGRSANTVVLLKHFTYEMLHLTKTDGGTFDNDKGMFRPNYSCSHQPTQPTAWSASGCLRTQNCY
jgi:hypothetical protein